MKSLCSLLLVMLVAGCVTRQPDHFYVIDAVPAAAAAPRSEFDRQVTLRVMIPSLVDRAEMVIAAAHGVSVLEHERWAAPLSDMISGALSRDIERRRSDVVVAATKCRQSRVPLTRIAVRYRPDQRAPDGALENRSALAGYRPAHRQGSVVAATPSSARSSRKLCASPPHCAQRLHRSIVRSFGRTDSRPASGTT